MALVEITAEIPAARADEVEAALLELGDPSWGLRENAATRRAWIVGIFADEQAARSAWAELEACLPDGLQARPSAAPLEDRDWKESYRDHFRASRFGRLHWVPVWERESYLLPPGEAVLWLDPGLAFGTGNHETTRLCAERLVALSPRRRVIDAGCGSGILALSAVLLGCGEVVGFDSDPEAVRVSLDNAALNGLADRVGFFVAELAAGLAGRPADLVLANIQADVLTAHAKALCAAVAPGGSLVLSGILAVESATVRAAFGAEAPGWDADSRTMGEWSDLQLTRPAA